MTLELEGQTAVVTGGGRGLGRAFAQALAAAGASVWVMARSQDELDETVTLVGPRARAVHADVTDAESVRAAFGQIAAVDVVVNNAGVLGPIGPFAETDFERWWQTMNVNVRGTMLPIHAALPGMIARRRGHIVNVVTGAFSAPYLSAYLTSKTAVVRATECLAQEAASSGVALFSFAPGTVRTAMTEHSLTSDEGRRWIPWFRRVFDEGLDLPAERPAAVVAALVSGRYDALSGLYLSSFDDLDAMLAERERIQQERSHVLMVRPHRVSEQAAAVAKVRDAASRQR